LAREWLYGYNAGGYLTSYTDPDNKVTDYNYTSGFTGPDLLETITDPPNESGNDPTATISYGFDANLNIDQVTEVTYAIGASSTFDYTWEYHDDEDDADCHDHGDFASEVTDPNAKTWTYCFKPRDEAGGERKTWTYDGEGNERTGEFNVDKQTETLTSGASGSTVATYAASKPDQLELVTDPKSGSTSGERTNIDYDHEPGAGDPDPKGQDYLPSSVTDPNNDCTRYEYDSTGRLTVAIIKLRGSGSDRSCSDETSGGVKYKYEYNSDGTLSKMADGNAGSSPPDADKTIYTYWASGDSGFVAGTAGLIKSVRKPGGDCVGTRKLCTSYAYDSSGRVKEVTDGKNQTTTMAYDVMDRTTKVMFNGDTTCASAATCTTYAYDAEGNMTERVEAAGTTTFDYDRMNRQTKINQPNSIEFTSTFDGVGNLTGYSQKIDSTTPADDVAYAYDGGNFVTSITDSAGTINTEVDDDGYIEQYTFPGANGVEIEYDILDNGKPDTATVTADQGSGAKLYDIGYDYTDGSDDEDQLQNRIVTDAGSALNGTTDYEYENGRLSEASDSSTAGPSYDYTHDNIGNVTTETKTGTATHFGYNRAGQLCWKASVTGTKLGSTCPSTPSGGTTYSHDAAGNNLMGGAAYNNRNQVTDLDSLPMGYLDLGNDKRTTVGTTTQADGPLGITGRKTGSAVTWYTRMPDGMILDSRKVGGDTQVYFTEPHNESVAALFSTASVMTASYLYSPYGDTTIHSEASGAGTDNPFRYISGWQDTGTNKFYKLGARYYDTHGHFTQPDPLAGSISDPRTMTAYSYAAGDPVNNSDPSGLITDPGPRPSGYQYAPNSGNLNDYCTAAPDEFHNGPNFRVACVIHDQCLAGSTPRGDCDTAILGYLKQACRARFGASDVRRYGCYGDIQIIYFGVRAGTVTSFIR
jgi:RHS repeat-associated protein